MTALLLAVVLGHGPAEFQAAFPAATLSRAPSGEQLTGASGFEAGGLGATPVRAARAFLARYGPAFGVSPRQELRLLSGTPVGRPGAVRFERRIGGRPVFGGDLVVGVDGRGAVVLVNTADVPPQVSGRWRLPRKAAVAAAAAELPGKVVGRARAARGWRPFGGAIRPVWRVDLATRGPPGEWRIDVDADTGKILFRTDLRVEGRPPPGPPRGAPLLR